MESTLQNVCLNIPKSDMKFFRELAKKMGWTVESKESVLKKYAESRPKGADLSDDDIMAEINAVRYQK